MRKISLLVLVSALVVSCNETAQYDGSKWGAGHGLAQSHSSLTCISFTDSAIEAYAKSNWDADNDGCVSRDEAAAVTSIPANAFAGNTSLASLDDLKQLPNLTSIGDNAFAGCTNLKNANLSSVTSVGDSAFKDCVNLTEANMPNASNVADNAFAGCTKLNAGNCSDGDKKCEGNKAYICVGGSWDAGSDCGSAGCDDITKACKSAVVGDCSDGDKKCEDNKAFVCADGSWGDGSDCGSLGCDDITKACKSAVVGDCSDGDKKCEDNKAYVCVDGSWGDGSDCGSAGCDDITKSCKSAVVGDCNDGDKKCEGNKAYVCAGGSWDAGSDCGSAGCDDITKSCKGAVVGDCNDGDKKCEDNKAYICVGGSWDAGSDCGSVGCDGDVCKETYRCEDGNVVSNVDGTSKACRGKSLCTLNKKDNAYCEYNFYDLLILGDEDNGECPEPGAEISQCLYDYDHHCDYSTPGGYCIYSPFSIYAVHKKCQKPYDDVEYDGRAPGVSSADGNFWVDLYGESCALGICSSGQCASRVKDTQCICDESTEGLTKTYCTSYRSGNDRGTDTEPRSAVVTIPCECKDGTCDWNWEEKYETISYRNGYCEEGTEMQASCPLPARACENGDTVCESDEFYICENQRWKKTHSCQFGCASDKQCLDDTPCENGALYCDSWNSFVCEDEHWKKVRSCHEGCAADGKRCKEDTPCVDGSTMCEDGKAFVCENQTWGRGTPCENFVCDGNVCKEDNKCFKGINPYYSDKCADGKAIKCSDSGELYAVDCAGNGQLCYVDIVSGEASCMDKPSELSGITSCSDDDFMKDTYSCETIDGEDYYVESSCRPPISALDAASYPVDLNYDQIKTVKKCHEGCDLSYGGCYDHYYEPDDFCSYYTLYCITEECTYDGSADGNIWSSFVEVSCDCSNHVCKDRIRSYQEPGGCIEGVVSMDADCSYFYNLDW